ncbi:MAG: 50S ribosomal protein L3 [Candidatus Aenigmatarchaeota archaeon]
MPMVRRPRRGSMGFFPRKRARREYPRVKSWPKASEAKPLGFAGYKAGMTHALVTETNPVSKLKGQAIAKAVTVIDCPPISVFGFRAYSSTTSGKKVLSDVLAEKLDKRLGRKIIMPKKRNDNLKKIEEQKAKISEIKLLCHTNPSFKKKPAVLEVGLGGSVEAQLKAAKEHLGKELKASDVFKESDHADVLGVTKGKGFEGVIKRFGARIQGRKHEHMHRKIAPLGQDEPAKTRHTVPAAGQLGFFSRCELNKRILKIGKGGDVKMKGGFLRYGNLGGDALLLEGSVPGPTKQLIMLRHPIRPRKTRFPVDLRYVSLESKQGV